MDKLQQVSKNLNPSHIEILHAGLQEIMQQDDANIRLQTLFETAPDTSNANEIALVSHVVNHTYQIPDYTAKEILSTLHSPIYPDKESSHYDLHMYFKTKEELKIAKQVYNALETKEFFQDIRKNGIIFFNAWSLYPIGPHPYGMTQINLITPEAYWKVRIWLECGGHRGLSILLHPNLGPGMFLVEHFEKPAWVGPKIQLKRTW